MTRQGMHQELAASLPTATSDPYAAVARHTLRVEYWVVSYRRAKEVSANGHARNPF